MFIGGGGVSGGDDVGICFCFDNQSRRVLEIDRLFSIQTTSLVRCISSFDQP